MNKRYEIFRCPNCSLNKSANTRTCGLYRVYKNVFTIKIKCRMCGHVMRYKLVAGGFANEE